MHRLVMPVTLTALLFGPATAQWGNPEPVPGPLKRGFDSISVGDAKRHLEFLAGPETEGRGSGQAGYQKAADYVADRFREWGLKPGGDDGTFFQHGTLYRSRTKAGYLSVGDEEVHIGKGLNLGQIYGDVNVNAPLVVVRVRDKKTDLPAGIDLKGAVVLLSGPGVDASFRIDLRYAQPAAVLNVQEGVPNVVDSVRRRKPEEWRVQGTISAAAARRLADAAAYSGHISGDRYLHRPVTVTTIGRAHLEAQVESGEVRVPNVIGVLPGTDRELSRQVVGLGAHLDHLGTDGSTIHYGADDDGSGCTALLQVAKAMARFGPKPKRTIVFMAFYGEEMGLLGSKLYAEKPKFPLKDMVAHLQMDMVGRNSYGVQNNDRNRVDKEEENQDTMRLVGSKRISTELHSIILDLNKHVGFRFLYDSEDVYTRSDHYSFAAKGVPIAFLFDGFTPDYHQPTDTVDKINWTKLTNAAKLFYLTAEELANRAAAPVKDVR